MQSTLTGAPEADHLYGTVAVMVAAAGTSPPTPSSSLRSHMSATTSPQTTTMDTDATGRPIHEMWDLDRTIRA